MEDEVRDVSPKTQLNSFGRIQLIQGLAKRIGSTEGVNVHLPGSPDQLKKHPSRPNIRMRGEVYTISAPYRAPPASKNATYPDFENSVGASLLADGWRLTEDSFAGSYLFIKENRYLAYRVALDWDDGKRESRFTVYSDSGNLDELNTAA